MQQNGNNNGESMFKNVEIEWLTLVLLNPYVPVFTNSVDPDQLASEEAN